MPFKKILLYKQGLLIYSLLLAMINILLTQFPLTSTFGYEFAAFNGLLLTILAGLHTFNFINKSEFVFTKLIKNEFILFLIPIFITLINSMLTMFCSFLDGLIFYLLIVSVSITFGITLAFLIGMVTKRFFRSLFIIIIILIALIPIAEIYYNPQVYFYSPLIGFFPGNIYDEGLSPDWKLFFHQLLILIFSFSVLYVLIKRITFVLRFKLILYLRFYLLYCCFNSFHLI